MHKGRYGWICAGALIISPSLAWAEPEDQQLECVEAYEKTQEARRAGNLLRARALAEMCVAEACHEVIRESCTTWQGELNTEIPSITVRVVDQEGNAVGGATVVIDGGEPLSSAGRTIELDPGTHSIDATANGYDGGSTTFELTRGEQEKPLELVLPKRPEAVAPPPPVERKPVPLWPAFVAGAVGAAGFVTLGVFGSQARAGDRDLDACAVGKTCSEDEVDKIRTQYTLANVGLVVGIAGAAGALGWSIFALSSGGERNVTLRVLPQGVSGTVKF